MIQGRILNNLKIKIILKTIREMVTKKNHPENSLLNKLIVS